MRRWRGGREGKGEEEGEPRIMLQNEVIFNDRHKLTAFNFPHARARARETEETIVNYELTTNPAAGKENYSETRR